MVATKDVKGTLTGLSCGNCTCPRSVSASRKWPGGPGRRRSATSSICWNWRSGNARFVGPTGSSGCCGNRSCRLEKTLDELRPEAAAGEGRPAGAHVCWTAASSIAARTCWRLGKAAVEKRIFCAAIAQELVRAGAQGLLQHVQPAGAGTADRQARPEAEPRAETPVRLRGLDHRRHRLRAAEPRGDGGAVHAAWPSVTSAARVMLTSNLPFSQVGGDLQGPDDHGGGDRPPGASQRDPGAEHPQLPAGTGQSSPSKEHDHHSRRRPELLVVVRRNF